MYKYIYKGHDRVSVHIGSNEDVDEGVSNEVPKKIDEIKIFQDARWVSPLEAMWRIYEFNLNEMQYPSVTSLELHLLNRQLVTYWKNKNLSKLFI